MTDEQLRAPDSPAAAEAGTLDDLLGRLGNEFGAATIDELWLFPARKAAAGESTLVVVSAFEEDPERRRVFTAQFAVSRDPKGAATVEETIEVQASVPAELVARVIDGVLRRMEDEATVPRYVRIAGDKTAWQALRAEARMPASG
jgi:hypothetical protein